MHDPSAVESRGYIRRVQPSDGFTAEQSQCALNVVSQDFQGSRYSSFTRSSESVSIGASDEYRARAQADCLYDVGAPANPAIHQNLYLTSHRVYNLRQSLQRSRYAVELAATVIRHNNCCGAFVHGAAGIVGNKNPFYDDWAGPEFSDPAQVVPSYGRTCQSFRNVDEGHRPLAGDHDVVERRNSAIEQKRSQPPRMS